MPDATDAVEAYEYAARELDRLEAEQLAALPDPPGQPLLHGQTETVLVSAPGEPKRMVQRAAQR